jgi:hypothetical protein
MLLYVCIGVSRLYKLIGFRIALGAGVETLEAAHWVVEAGMIHKLVESRIPVSTAMGTVSRRLDSFSQNNP